MNKWANINILKVVLDVILTPLYRLHHLQGLNPFEYQDGCLLFTFINHSATFILYRCRLYVGLLYEPDSGVDLKFYISCFIQWQA